LIETSNGERVRPRFLVMAVGCLSAGHIPSIPGLETFAGRWFHTGKWPHEPVDLAGKRVGIIGTGSTGIQCTPVIAERAEQVFVFQRTAHYAVPARNGPLDARYEGHIKATYREHRKEARASRTGFVVPGSDESALAVSPEARRLAYEDAWAYGGFSFTSTFSDIGSDLAANETAAEFVRTKIREIVRDPQTAEGLLPRGYPIGAKRLCLESGYYASFNRDNVTLVDVKHSPITGINSTGVMTADSHYPVDVVVFATGFDAMTGALLNIDIRGRHGRSLRDAWADGPKAYLGVAVSGFPNLFIMTGPGSPSVLSNMVVSIEQHASWISAAIANANERGFTTIEATREAQDAWVEHVRAVADRTMYRFADSWYVGANVPGKPRVFMPYIGGVGSYRQQCDEVSESGYRGFALGVS
jgi:cyclohexanone monooxygenase